MIFQPTKNLHCILLPLIMLLWPVCLAAQFINIGDSRVRLDSVGRAGSVEAGVHFVQNNVFIRTISTAARADWLAAKRTWLLMARYNRVGDDTRNILNDGFAHLRHGRIVNSRLTIEALLQAQYNQQLRLRFRGLAGVGPRLKILKTDKGVLAGGILYLYEYDEVGRDAIFFFRDHRLSSYLSLRWQLSPVFSVAHTIYYQPVLTEMAEARLASSNSFDFRISRRFSFLTTFNLVYDSRTVRDIPEVPSVTYSFRNVLRLTF